MLLACKSWQSVMWAELLTGEHESTSQLLGCPDDERLLGSCQSFMAWPVLVSCLGKVHISSHICPTSLRFKKTGVWLDAMVHACNPALNATQTGKVQG